MPHSRYELNAKKGRSERPSFYCILVIPKKLTNLFFHRHLDSCGAKPVGASLSSTGGCPGIRTRSYFIQEDSETPSIIPSSIFTLKTLREAREKMVILGYEV